MELIEGSGRSTDVSAQTEAVIGTVRIVLGVLSAFVIVGYGTLSGSSSLTVAMTTVAIIVTVALLNMAGSRLRINRRSLIAMQIADTATTVALSVALDDALDHTSWALLVIPVAGAAVRLGPIASLCTWAAGSAAAVALNQAGWVGRRGDIGEFIQIPGVLLATAVTVGLLAGWIRELWHVQNESTVAASVREKRLGVLESSARDLKNASEQRSIEICISAIVGLGFDAATAQTRGTAVPFLSCGATELVAEQEPTSDLEEGAAMVTIWSDGKRAHAHSATALEPHSQTMFTGWSAEPFGRDLAESLLTMVVQISTAIELARLVASLRDAASRNPITGVVKGGSFEERVDEATRQPGQFAVAMLDLGNLEQINDTYGRDTADQILDITARRVAAAVGEDGHVARCGDDRLGVLLQPTTRPRATTTCQEILRATSQPVASANNHLYIGLSIGLAVASPQQSAADVLASANRALHQAESRYQRIAMMGDDIGQISAVSAVDPAGTSTGVSEAAA